MFRSGTRLSWPGRRRAVVAAAVVLAALLVALLAYLLFDDEAGQPGVQEPGFWIVRLEAAPADSPPPELPLHIVAPGGSERVTREKGVWVGMQWSPGGETTEAR